MKVAVTGRLIEPKKGEKLWAVEIPVLGVHTQGKNRKNALAMAKDAVETVIENVKVEIQDNGESFNAILPANKETFAFLLRRLRIAKQLTMEKVAHNMKATSVNAYARYETGDVMPGVDKFTELIHAIDPKKEPILNIG
jgi:predicted RNase H-like HicB family nuclease